MPLTVLYDHDCNFCVVGIAALVRLDRDERLRFVPIQADEGAELLSDLTPDERLESWHAVAADGRRWSGGHAFEPILAELPRGAWPAALAARVGTPADWAYGLVARNRTRLSKLVPGSLKARSRRVVAIRQGVDPDAAERDWLTASCGLPRDASSC